MNGKNHEKQSAYNERPEAAICKMTFFFILALL